MNLVKVKRMTAAAAYENGPGRKDLAICRYYKRDYLGLRMISTFLLTTLAYFLIVGLLAAANLAEILEEVTRMNLVRAGSEMLIGYIVLEAVFLTIAYVSGSSRYNRARRRVRHYTNSIRKLLESAEEEQ